MVSDERVACDGPNLFEKFSKTVPCKEEASHCAAQSVCSAMLSRVRLGHWSMEDFMRQLRDNPKKLDFERDKSSNPCDVQVRRALIPGRFTGRRRPGNCSLVAYLWLRCPKCPNEVDVLATFRRLQAECLRVYAELLTVVALTGAQETQTEEPLAEAGNNRCREKAEKRREPRCVCPGWGSSAINIGSGAPLRGTVTTKPGGYTW
eukprot:s1111_g23.t1